MLIQTMKMNRPKREIYRELALIGEEISKNAYPPFSDYRVGGVCLLWDGRVYTGVNVEDPSIGLTVHGEQSSIIAAIADGALEDARRAGLDEYSFIKAVAVLPQRMFEGWPCGHCGDYMSGFGTDMDIVVRTADGKDVEWAPLGKVMPNLPDARMAKKLTSSGSALMLLDAAGDHAQQLAPAHIELGTSDAQAHRKLLEIARRAAHRSYAPYTKRPSGAAVWLWDGSVYAGSRVENVGYTRSNHPEQGAIEAAIADGALARAVAAGIGPQQFVKTVAYVALGQPAVWPAGSSRQCLCDFGLDMQIVIESASGRPMKRTLRQLFPHAFAADVLSYWVKKG